MDVMEAIKKRYSVRNFKKDKIEEKDLKLLLESARLAPSARNIQNRKYIVIEDINEEMIDACNNQRWISTCPMMIAGIVDPNVNKWADTDMAIAFEHIVLESVELGLGTCWVGAFDEQKMKRLLDVPDNMKVYALLAVGHPSSEHFQRTKKMDLDKVWSKERYKW